MGKTHAELDEALTSFIRRQRMFFVATAPLSGDGHVNLSPKGLDSFRVLSPRRVAYADFNGSGIETVAHLRENGRVTIMFCAFDGRPNILRLYGRGRAVVPTDAEFASLSPAFAAPAPLRSIIAIDLTRITDSCGYGVPRYEYVGDRDQMQLWADRKGAAGIAAYQREKNTASIDGLPGLS